MPNLVRNAFSEVARTDRLAALRNRLDTKQAEQREATAAAERILTLLQRKSSPLLECRFRELDGKATASAVEAKAIRPERYSSEGQVCDEAVALHDLRQRGI